MKMTFPKYLIAAALLSFCSASFAQESRWLTDYAKALELAKTQNKVVLLDFTGSDWCGWCMKIKEETLDTPAFKRYAQKNLVLVEVDFPKTKPISSELKAQNDQLKQQFGVKGYPTFVLVDKDGKELGRQKGYLEGGPKAFIDKLNTFYQPAEGNSGSANGDSFNSFFKKPAQTPAP